MYRIPFVLLADRTSGLQGPSAGHRQFGDAIRLPGPSEMILQLRSHLLPEQKPRTPTSKPKIMYLSRQGTWRNFTSSVHEALKTELSQIQDEGLATVVVETFGVRQKDYVEFDTGAEEFLPIREQVKRMSDVDVSCKCCLTAKEQTG
jgi:hypothetical protein